jgi:putative ABC transport system permease protein
VPWTRFFRRARWDRERERELETYLEMETEENIARGMTPEGARYAARRKLGNPTLIREEIYRMNSLTFIESLWQDVRCGLRMLRKNAGFAAVAILTLALGIGANTAIFSVIHAVLLNPLPYTDPERIVLVLESNPSRGFPQFSVSPPNYVDWKKDATSFEQITPIARGDFNYTGGPEPERLSGARVGSSFFAVMGATPGMGRTFLPEDDVVGKASVVVLGYGLWTRHFGSDPQIVGKSLTLDGQSYRVVGVMQNGFQFPRGVDLWLPSEFDADALSPGARGAHYLRVMARLKPGVSIDKAQAEMVAISKRLEQLYPRTNTGWSSRLLALNEATVGNVRPTLLVLFGAVGFLLLIACANVANLLLARATARQREIAIRFSLGANRWRIARQLLTESILLSGIATAAGLLLAEWAIRALRTLPPSNLPRAASIGLDLPVLIFAGGVAVFTGLLFGVAPALQITRGAPAEILKEGGRGSSAGRHGVRSALVVLETTLALVLLVGSGLLLKSFLRLQTVDPGFQYKNIVTTDISLPRSKYSTEAQKIQFFDQLLERTQFVPGVKEVAASSGNPMEGSNLSFAFSTKGLQALSPAEQPSAGYYVISANYFHMLHIPLLVGRYFAKEDTTGSPRVAIISESLAQRFFHDRNPVGQMIAIGVGAPRPDGPLWREIVGVVGDIKDDGLGGAPTMTVYEPYRQMGWGDMNLFLRSDGDALQMAAMVRSEVVSVDKDQPVGDISTGEQLMAEAVAQPQLRTMLLSLFAGLALILASLGIYGVMSNTVAQRTHEIGVRMALGAGQSTVLRLVLTNGMRLTLLGIVLGMVGAFALTRLMKSFLFHVTPTDPATFLEVALFLFLVALLASYIPARCAMRVDPVVALRYE